MPKIIKSIAWVASEVTRRPLNAIAEEIGVSDVGLGQFCKRHNIPVFNPSYFRRLDSKSDAGDCPQCGTKRKVRKYINNLCERGFTYCRICPNCHANQQREGVRGRRKIEGQCVGCGGEPQPGLYYCSKCHNVSVSNKRLRARLRKDKLVKIMGGKCSECGGQFHNAAYDFHHLSDKFKSMSHMLAGNSWEATLLESKKCRLLCAVCHRLGHKYRLIGDVPSESGLYKRAFVQNRKKQPCQDCGLQFHPTAMEFDHRDSLTKSFNISNVACRRYTIGELTAEIIKCDLVCANCHRVRTFSRFGR